MKNIEQQSAINSSSSHSLTSIDNSTNNSNEIYDFYSNFTPGSLYTHQMTNTWQITILDKFQNELLQKSNHVQNQIQNNLHKQIQNNYTNLYKLQKEITITLPHLQQDTKLLQHQLTGILDHIQNLSDLLIKIRSQITQ
ncbi:hypothetical protein ABK040_009243 [Willaertia magna]